MTNYYLDHYETYGTPKRVQKENIIKKIWKLTQRNDVTTASNITNLIGGGLIALLLL